MREEWNGSGCQTFDEFTGTSDDVGLIAERLRDTERVVVGVGVVLVLALTLLLVHEHYSRMRCF